MAKYNRKPWVELTNTNTTLSETSLDELLLRCSLIFFATARIDRLLHRFCVVRIAADTLEVCWVGLAVDGVDEACWRSGEGEVWKGSKREKGEG